VGNRIPVAWLQKGLPAVRSASLRLFAPVQASERDGILVDLISALCLARSGLFRVVIFRSDVSLGVQTHASPLLYIKAFHEKRLDHGTSHILQCTFHVQMDILRCSRLAFIDACPQIIETQLHWVKLWCIRRQI